MAGRIFVSYRLADTAAQAGWLSDRLAGHFGPQQVVKDVDSAQAAADIPELIANAVASCDVLLALIGRQWLTAPTQYGAQSLADPSDVVRLAIESAMTRGIQIVPVLIDGAPMPSAGELPPHLAGLTRLQALELTPQRPDLDAARLLQVLDQRIAERQATQVSGVGGQATITAQPPAWRPPAGQPASGQPASGQTAPPPPASGQPAPGQTAPPPPAYGQPAPGQTKLMPRRRRTRTIALVAGGVVVVAGALVAFLVVPSGKSAPSAASSAAADKQHRESLHKAATSPSAASSSGPAASSKIIATDDFSTKKINWTDDSSQTAGQYTGGAYRLSVTGYDGQNELARPADAADGLGGATPMNLSLSVDARKLEGAPAGYGYGVAFRSDSSGDFYAFVVEDHAVAIQKWVGNGAEVKGSPAAVTTSDLHVGAADRLQAVCQTIDGGQAVHMEFWLNGKKLVDYTDRDHPYTQGYLGLYVESISDAPSTAAAEFDNFTAAQL